MHLIYSDKKVIGNPMLDTYAYLSGDLDQELNTADVFTFTLPSGHPYAEEIQPRVNVIKLTNDSATKFIGDVISKSTDILGSTKFTCQGCLAWLNDIVIVRAAFRGTVPGYVAYLLDAYNAECPPSRRITLGEIDVPGNIVVNNAVEMHTIFELFGTLISTRGGYLFLRYDGDIIYLDYKLSKGRMSGQAIAFGSNMLDLDNLIDASEVFTRVYPIGNNGMDISSVNNGKCYVENTVLKEQLGNLCISKMVELDSEDPSELMAYAQECAAAAVVYNQSIQLSSLDLSRYDIWADVIEIGDLCRVFSRVHGLDTVMTVSKKHTGLADDSGDNVTLGEVSSTLSGLMSMGADSSNAIADYLIGSGEVSGWRYNKWASGTYECWRRVAVNAVQCNIALGNEFRTAFITMPEYPSNAFVEPPYEFISFETYSGTGAQRWPSGAVGMTDEMRCTRPPVQALTRPTSGTVTGAFNIKSVGRWK